MASLKEIRKRIGSVKKTKKITKAMNMVAAAKLRRTERKLMSLRPYADSLINLIQTINFHIITDHPFYKKREEGEPLYVFITSDKGLCGAFNSRIIKKSEKLIKNNPNSKVVLIGKKIKKHYDRHGYNYEKAYINIFDELNYNITKKISNYLADYFVENQNIQEVIFVFNRFKNSIVSKVTTEKFLPRKEEEKEISEEKKEEMRKIYITEPDIKTMLTYSINEYLEAEAYRISLESLASEHGARMAAMDAATDNANDMIENLTKEANRKRQAEITTEINEIVGGANALEG